MREAHRILDRIAEKIYLSRAHRAVHAINETPLVPRLSRNSRRCI